MQALSDRVRLRVLSACDQHELTVAELCAVLQMPQSTVSRHLKTLTEGTWLNVRRDGTSRHYSVDKDNLPPSARRLWKVIRTECHDDPALRADEARLEQILRARQSRSQAFFASTVGQWDKLRTELFGTNIDAAAFAAFARATDHVADLGCGTGQTAAALAPFVSKLTCVDASGAMIKVAQKRLAGFDNVAFHRSPLEELAVDDGAIDIAVMSLVLHHTSEPVRVLCEAARVLAPAGRLILVDMQRHTRAEYKQQMGHVWLGFSDEEINKWFADARLRDLRIVHLPPDPNAKGPPLFVACAQK